MSDQPHKSSVTHKIIAVQLGIIASLLLLITIAILSGGVEGPPPNTTDPTDELVDSVLSGAPISHEDWESMKRIALSEPPLKWTSTSTDWLYQGRDFEDWKVGKAIVPEVWLAIQEWLSDDAAYKNEPSSIEKIITNEPTGAQFAVSGKRTNRGASCTIRFIDNVNWK